MAVTSPLIVGADPMTLKWNVVRGDTAVLRVEFYEPDEETVFDTTGWRFEAAAYEYAVDITDPLSVSSGDGYVEVTASADVTSNWGAGRGGSRVSELGFDVQVTMANNVIWTPVVGTISVIGDVTGANL